ncbi:MAG: hypothetical protein QFB87_03820 [Patescibacteria group bacterium]|nr:hypothetical protein [Patescibacteria group bacterium]
MSGERPICQPAMTFRELLGHKELRAEDFKLGDCYIIDQARATEQTVLAPKPRLVEDGARTFRELIQARAASLAMAREVQPIEIPNEIADVA